MSASTVRRWLTQDALKPWQHRSWIFIRDPDFRTKAAHVLDPYPGTWQGTTLDEDEYVISSDEKTSIQARCRCHPTLAPGQARAMRVNHEYGRGGALAYRAAYDVHHAKVFGRCEPKTGIAPFTALVTQVMTTEPTALVTQVMTTEPYANAKRVLVTVRDSRGGSCDGTPGLVQPVCASSGLTMASVARGCAEQLLGLLHPGSDQPLCAVDAAVGPRVVTS
ncbi:hypothetical protein QMK19_38400 [Streptomyces sp. H10-C2]|nr:hypothetical protein [Streptomyces sp. H10-C2]MDJ0375317.1 hypothetical protein [Streptomyces sp. H10-C2]